MAPRFPDGTPRPVVVTAFEMLRFRVVHDGEHISMARQNPDGTRTLLTLPNRVHLKGSTLTFICAQIEVL